MVVAVDAYDKLVVDTALGLQLLRKDIV
ncbi:hypothetical protein A2U01_0113821, partial [Trifolium medium]|nr:hypothetical protein [Trifolium medium]